jgi:copper(I)-binding protein
VKRILVLVLSILFLLSACGSETGIEVREAWMRPAAQGENGAVYFVIHNNSPTEELVGVSTPAAEAAEVHESRMSGDVMQMHPLETVPLPAGAEVAFAPGGLHIMLIRLKKDLQIGEEIEVTLHFKNVEDLKVLVPVQETRAPAENH